MRLIPFRTHQNIAHCTIRNTWFAHLPRQFQPPFPLLKSRVQRRSSQASKASKKGINMTKTLPVIALTMLTWALLAPANTLAQAPGRRGEGRGTGQAQAAQQQRAPQVVSKSVRPSGSSLGKIRVGASSEDIWFGWTVAIPTTEFPTLTFSEAAEKADALALASVQGSDQQIVSPEIPKKLSYHLKPGERQAVALRLRELSLNMPIYAVESIPSDESSRRQMFEFAKELGVRTIVSSPAPGLLADLDKLATEFEVNIAVRNGSRSQTPDY
jgi:hypothetical protein